MASEPLVESPVGICFDEDGRLFVVEMRGYPDRQEAKMSRIKLLESSKGDGVYGQSHGLRRRPGMADGCFGTITRFMSRCRPMSFASRVRAAPGPPTSGK